ncbi:MAG: MFS transporter [Defluviitaleaceae bacterium]|nr:MFS transporter [Defluviitaleaceae bacterium]
MTTKLWNKNFSLVAICNAIALLGNMTLSFALAYYVRDVTGSEAMFGLALSAPYIALLIMSPIGGIIADRVRKQRILFWVDVSILIIIVLYLAIDGMLNASLFIIFVKMLAINAAQGVYMSAVNSAIPLIVPTEKLESGNAIMGMVNALISAVGMALAAVLYDHFGLTPILIIFAAVFAAIAILDLFIRVPYEPQKSETNIVKMIKKDMSQALKFIIKDKPFLAGISVILFVFSATVISLLLIGVPILVTDTLGMDLSLVGISQIFIALGGLLGGIVSGTVGARLSIKKSPIMLATLSFLPVPMGLAVLFNMPTMTAFVIITIVCTLIMFVNTMFIITAITFVQKETPPDLLGKVLSLLTMLPFLAQATGQFAFGVLFEQLTPWIVIFIAVVISAVATVFSFKIKTD